MNINDQLVELINENQKLKFKNNVLITKQALYDLIFDYFKMTLLWFHSFIVFFSSLQSNTNLPTSFIALNEHMFTLPDNILKIHTTFLNHLFTFNEHDLKNILKNELDLLFNYDFNEYRDVMNISFKKINQLNVVSFQNKLFEKYINNNNVTIQNVKNILNISNNIESESFLFNLKKFDILWNLVGCIFSKTPFLIKESVGELRELNNNFSLQHFTTFFENYFKKHFNCILNNKHKLLIDKSILPKIIFDDSSKLDLKIIQSSFKTHSVHKILNSINSQFLEKHVNLTWLFFLEKFFKSNQSSCNEFFKNIENNSTESSLLSIVLNNLHCREDDLIRNCIFSINRENILLKQLVKFISINIVFKKNSDYLKFPLIQIINKLKEFYEKKI
jgi:hypothetical protein